MKESIKQQVVEEKGNLCFYCGEPVDVNNCVLFDVHRGKQKVVGGTYDDIDNVNIAHPWCHMKEHGTLRTRTDELSKLKSMVDDREQVMKLRNKIANQLSAYQRKTDDLSDITRKFLEEELKRVNTELSNRSNLVASTVKEYAKHNSLISSALGVIGIGEMTVAYLTVYVDLNEDRHASSLWKYAGLHKASSKRYELDDGDDLSKGRGGNKALRTALWNNAVSIEKNRKSPYRLVYDRTKDRLSVSDKLPTGGSRNTNGILVKTVPWKDVKPCHRRGAALREVMKCMLADYWYVGRTLMGLPTNPVYAEAKLGKDGHKTVDPENRGWKF